MSILSAMLLLLLVLDPIGNVPLFLSALKNVAHDRHRRIIIRESCIGLGVLLMFLFFGKYLLMLLHVSQSSLSIAGGIVLFLISIKMIFARSDDLFGAGPEGEPFVVPLAVPLIAGPSALTTVLLLVAREPARWLAWLTALVLAWFISLVILVFSNRLRKLLRVRGIMAMERLTGMLLTTVAVEMLLNGLKQSFFIK
ncbi:MAG TPA: MarC family protein [bacterium]